MLAQLLRNNDNIMIKHFLLVHSINVMQMQNIWLPYRFKLLILSQKHLKNKPVSPCTSGVKSGSSVTIKHQFFLGLLISIIDFYIVLTHKLDRGIDKSTDRYRYR